MERCALCVCVCVCVLFSLAFTSFLTSLASIPVAPFRCTVCARTPPLGETADVYHLTETPCLGVGSDVADIMCCGGFLTIWPFHNLLPHISRLVVWALTCIIQ
ncbi:hypothetical protein IF1G_03883 [Cordyceps javanica]|uniref:Secreted protein n=1 Tax=Cordyceps javanica TaxID=43265 RepID=A0A545V8U3_9HYPO|nr:hypothetical protein IF1G_03883 [Cordyceps javanica]